MVSNMQLNHTTYTYDVIRDMERFCVSEYMLYAFQLEHRRCNIIKNA